MSVIQSTSNSIRLLLVDTSQSGSLGSMGKYGVMVERAMKGYCEGSVQFDVRRISLAPGLTISRLVPARFRMWLSHLAICIAARARLAPITADIVHILDGSYLYLARFLAPSQHRIVMATVHDLIPLLQLRRELQHAPVPSAPARMVITENMKLLGRLDRIIAVSRNTKEDLVRLTGVSPEKIAVVYSGLSSDSRLAVPLKAQGGNSGGQRYIFHIGHNGYYKNRPGVLRIFAGVMQHTTNIRLKMAGPPPDKTILGLAESLRISDHIDFINFPDNETLQQLYRNAAVFLFPSIYEGFGWPPLEAMQAGCPVVCSDVASLPEIAGDAAALYSLFDEHGMIAACCRVLTDNGYAEHLVRKGRAQSQRFSVDEMGNQLAGEYVNAVRAI